MDGQDTIQEVYYVKLKYVCKFEMVIGFVSKGAPQNTLQQAEMSRDVTKLSFVVGYSEGVCATYNRIICATNV